MAGRGDWVWKGEARGLPEAVLTLFACLGHGCSQVPEEATAARTGLSWATSDLQSQGEAVSVKVLSAVRGQSREEVGTFGNC